MTDWMGRSPNAGWDGPWTVNGACTCTSFVTTGASTLVAATASGLVTCNAGLTVAGPLTTVPVAPAGTTYTILSTDTVILVNADACAIVLPNTATSAGRQLYIKQAKAGGTTTITGYGSQVLEGSGTHTLEPNKGIHIVATATAWFKLSSI